MNKIYNKPLSYIFVTFFLLYWIAVFILSLPPNKAGKAIVKFAPRFKSEFGTFWKLFTPAPTYNPRLYFIVRDIGKVNPPDTIEVLATLSIKKRNAAPFNQREINIDYLVNNSLNGLLLVTWQGRKKPDPLDSSTLSLEYIDQAINAASYKKKYQVYLGTLTNYCRMVLIDKKIDTSGKEVKMLIRQKITPPFNAPQRISSTQKETRVFETSFKPLNP
ncbi:MAG: hypothetical protein ABIN94_19290 [Ferruginibacter sp.]